MKILVLGGDGYLGWPTALHLSERGHDVAVADNFARRQYDYELGADRSSLIFHAGSNWYRATVWEPCQHDLRWENAIGVRSDPGGSFHFGWHRRSVTRRVRPRSAPRASRRRRYRIRSAPE